jgi:hypothetical protein
VSDETGREETGRDEAVGDETLNDEDPKLYGELASWFHLLTAPAGYAEGAAFYGDALVEAVTGRPRTLLELGSGGANTASHLKKRFDLTLVDRSQTMLALSRTINPECEHLEGDMRSVRLRRQFDAVLIHDAISYLTSEADLRAAIETAFVHCRPGGAAIFVPDHVRETFRPATDSGGHDGEQRSLRYLEWTWDPDPSDTSYVTDFAYLLREADGAVRVVHDRHLMGLFGRDVWLRILTDAGFNASVLSCDRSERERPPCDPFLGVRPAAS